MQTYYFRRRGPAGVGKLILRCSVFQECVNGAANKLRQRCSRILRQFVERRLLVFSEVGEYGDVFGGHDVLHPGVFLLAGIV